jgi:MFS transporter, ACS family, D-galactonate transporter
MFAVTGLGGLLWIPGWLLLSKKQPAPPVETVAKKAKKTVPLWKAFFLQPVFWALAGCIFFISYFWYFVLTWIPTYLVSSRGLSTLSMGRVLSIPLAAMAVVTLGGGAYADRIAARASSVFQVRRLFLACGLLGASCLLVLNVAPDNRFVTPILLVSICSFGIASSNFWTIAQHVAPSSTVARTIGTLNTVSQIAGASAPLITGLSLGPQKHFSLAILLASVSPLLAAALLFFISPRALERFKEALFAAVEA